MDSLSARAVPHANIRPFRKTEGDGCIKMPVAAVTDTLCCY